MRKNLLSVLLAVALLLLSTTAAFAQLPEPFCGQLSADDCEILTMSQEAQLELSSYTSAVQATTFVGGIPGLPFDELTFSWGQDTIISVDPEVTQAMMALQAGGAEAMMENMEELADTTVEFYRTLGVDAQIDFVMPEEIAALLSAQAGIEVPAELNLDIIMKDGFAYIATAGLAFLDPSLPEQTDWLGIDLASAVEMGFEQSLNTQDAAQQQQMMQSMALSSLLSSEEVRALFEDFVQVERANDDEIDGVEVAVFEHGFDFAGFLASPGFWQFVNDNLEMINQISDTPITAEEVQQAQMALTFLGPALLQGLTFQSTNSIGVDDYFPYAQTVDFNWDLSGLLRFAATAGALPAGSPTDAAIGLQIDAANADFNDAPEIEAPEGATIIPLNAMQ
jgi:hypothetical protein